MRIIQIVSKSTPLADNPRIGYGSQDNARMPLGTVPVESDGSVYCEAPIGKPIYFQLLDEKGMAVQSMRSVTYVHQGEQLSCVGCHEDKWEAPPASPVTIAMQRPPSKIAPEVGGVEPVNFYRLVKPVFDSKCQTCHAQNGRGPRDMSYGALEPYAFYFVGGGDNCIPYHGGSRSTPGKFGSQYARMGKAMLSTTHRQAREDGRFTEEDMRRVTLWLDGNSDEFGAYHDINRQRAGQLVWPELDVDPENPLGVDTRDSIPTGVSRQTATTQHSVMVGALGRKVALPASFAGRPFTINILDLNGRLLREIAVNSRSDKTPEYPGIIGKGVYIVCCKTGSATVTQKVAKVR